MTLGNPVFIGVSIFLAITRNLSVMSCQRNHLILTIFYMQCIEMPFPVAVIVFVREQHIKFDT